MDSALSAGILGLQSAPPCPRSPTYYSEFSKPWRSLTTGHMLLTQWETLFRGFSVLIYRCLSMIPMVSLSSCRPSPYPSLPRGCWRYKGMKDTIFHSASLTYRTTRTVYGYCPQECFHVFGGTATGSGTSPSFIISLVLYYQCPYYVNTYSLDVYDIALFLI